MVELIIIFLFNSRIERGSRILQGIVCILIGSFILDAFRVIGFEFWIIGSEENK